MRIRTRTELGALLRSERERQKMTQQQLANRIGTSRRWVSAIETGAENPTLDLLLRWLGALSLRFSIAPTDKLAGAFSRSALDEIISRSRSGTR